MLTLSPVKGILADRMGGGAPTLVPCLGGRWMCATGR